MKLYYGPGACSLGIHILLHEIGRPFEVQPVSLRDGEQRRTPFTDVNPKSKVPALMRDDGSVLTEYGAIAWWLAATNPESGLLPADPDHTARALEAMDYAVATMHMQGFGRIFRPSNFTPNPADEDAVRARGREIFAAGLALMDRALAGGEWVAGPYSIADSALFYVSRWAAFAKLDLPPHVAAHHARMKVRPAVQRALAAEGLS